MEMIVSLITPGSWAIGHR